MPLLLDCVDHVEKGTSVSTAVLGHRSRPETNRSRVRRPSARALSVLGVLRDAGNDVGVIELARALDLHASTRTGSFGPWLPLGTPCRMRNRTLSLGSCGFSARACGGAHPWIRCGDAAAGATGGVNRRIGQPGHPRRRRGAGRSAGRISASVAIQPTGRRADPAVLHQYRQSVAGVRRRPARGGGSAR